MTYFLFEDRQSAHAVSKNGQDHRPSEKLRRKEAAEEEGGQGLAVLEVRESEDRGPLKITVVKKRLKRKEAMVLPF